MEASVHASKVLDVATKGIVMSLVAPTIFRAKGHPPGEIQKVLRDAFNNYRDGLPHSSQSLLDRYELRDAVIKGVGVDSVGTAC
jgi:hypothetical protein